MGSVHTLQGATRFGAVDWGSYGRRVTLRPTAAGIYLLVVAILASPILDNVARNMWVGFGVFAVPCGTVNTTAGVEAGEGGTLNVIVSPTTNMDLTSVFNCEGGNFEVVWSGAVNVSGTIHIGQGTTVNIVGDNSSIDSSDTVSITGSSSTTNAGSGNSTSHDEVDDLTSTLSIPSGLTSAAVGIGSSETSMDTDDSLAFGPIFYVDGGQLLLNYMAIRGGLVVNSTTSPAASGAGIHAEDSTVTITECEFEDNFAEFFGGGVFGNRSTLVVVDSVFRRCRAGFQSKAGDEDVDGAGGGIGGEYSDILIDGCLFEDCYASKKGGGMHMGNGQTSVVGSVFYNNSAGSDNVEDETEIGEGAAVSFTTCVLSFDGRSSCGVNDTIIVDSHVGRKGGAVAIGSGDAPSHVEFHRCLVANSTTGLDIEDDPQGEGGAFSVSTGVTLVLSDCVLKNNYCGNKGGVITLSSGDDWEDNPGPIAILINSSFTSNTADLGGAGVVNIGEFAALVVAGGGNVFEENTCGEDGAVFGGTTDTNITVEGGMFRNNEAQNDGGVIRTSGIVEILGGEFIDNIASGIGGVVISSDDSTTIIVGGMFEQNTAFDGGVVSVGTNSNLWVRGGQFSGNTARNSGGAFSVGDGNLQISGGNFSLNAADFGGFLYKEGGGTGSCEGACILRNEGVNGGAIYAVQDAMLDWACDLKGNSALAGPAIYARDNATVILREVSLLDNDVVRGSVVFMVDSILKTYQVEFKDTTESSEITAVQVDAGSTYTAEDTSFDGFHGEAVVFSEGTLFMDDCDFRYSTATQLVYTAPDSTVMIRNTVLGDNNYLALANAASLNRDVPTADSLTNVNITCGHGIGGGAESTKDNTSSSSSPVASSPCSEGSACFDGDVGVYCQCYLQRSSSEPRCVNGDGAGLILSSQRQPTITFYPELVEGDLLLSYSTHDASFAVTDRSTTATTIIDESSPSSGGSIGSEVVPLSSEEGSNDSDIGSSSSGSSSGSNYHNVNNIRSKTNCNRSTNIHTNCSSSTETEQRTVLISGESASGVVWSVQALQHTVSGTSVMDWTVFPSVGLLLPGENITMRVVTLPSSDFDGTTSATFQAVIIGMDSSSVAPTALTGGELGYVEAEEDALDETYNISYHGSTPAQHAQLTPGTSSASQYSYDSALDHTSGVGSNVTSSASFNVTFYHCNAGQVWVNTTSRLVASSDGDTTEACLLCRNVVEGDTEGVECNGPGATIGTLPLEEGFSRLSLTQSFIRKCSNKNACRGGSSVASVQDYCEDGYEGPVCTVCAPGYGRGSSNVCHRCTPALRLGMSIAAPILLVIALVVLAIFAVYLVFTAQEQRENPAIADKRISAVNTGY